MANYEESNISKGIIGSIFIHAIVLFLLFYFAISTPNPPLEEFGGSGIELNYGVDPEGYGDVQTKNEASNEPLNEEVSSSEVEPYETAVSEPNNSEPEPILENSPIIKTENPEDANLEEKKIEKKEQTKQVEKVKETPVIEKPVSEIKPELKNNKTVNENTNGKVGTSNTNGGNNNGDRSGKVGDQGNPQGTLDAKALYGNLGSGGDGAGGSGGNKLEMSGWKPLFRIEKKDATNENGKIVFLIKVDDQGELVSISPIEKTVSPAVVEFYRKQIEENWAVERAKENVNPPPISTGRYTVFVKSK